MSLVLEIRQSAGHVTFLVRVQPRASRTELAGEWQGALRVRLAAPPIENRANEALCRFLAACLNVPLAAVRIARGERSRKKRVEISGVTVEQVRAQAALSSGRTRPGEQTVKTSKIETSKVKEKDNEAKNREAMPQIEAIQAELRSTRLDGWLFYDFHHRDPIAARVLGLENGMGTRRWFYLIPARGAPRKLVHRIESGALDALAGQKARVRQPRGAAERLARV